MFLEPTSCAEGSREALGWRGGDCVGWAHEWGRGVRMFYKVEMAADGWGLLMNEGTLEQPKFRVLAKGSEWWMERLAADMNGGGVHAGKLLGLDDMIER